MVGMFVGYLDRATNKSLSSGKSTFRQVRIYIIFVFWTEKKTQNHSHIISNYREISQQKGGKK